MRLVLLGGLSTLLAGLVALGGVLLVERRAKPLTREVEQPDEPAPPAAPREVVRARRLPSVVSAACTPRAGWACWRGRLRLSEAVRRAWVNARVADSGDSSDDETGAEGGSSDQHSHQEGATAGGAASAEGGDQDEKEADDDGAVLPPVGSFAPFFTVRAVPWSDQPRPPSSVEAEGNGSDLELELEEVTAQLEADGTFLLDIPPGTYDVEVESEDEHLVGGTDGLVARPGDARDGIDLVLGESVTIAGRVVDGDGIGDHSNLEVHRLHRDEEAFLETSAGGRFVANGLRPGLYVLVAEREGVSGEAVPVRAPLDGIELQVTRWPTAMIILGHGRDDPAGRCPKGVLTLIAEGGDHERRDVHLRGCQALVPNARPGSTWRVVGIVGGRRVERVVSFGAGKPLMPVCVDDGCRSDEAAVEIRVVDARGDVVEMGDIETLENPRDVSSAWTSIAPVTSGLRAGDTLALRATAGSLMATTTVWLMAGVNDVVIRLPGMVPAGGESATTGP